MEQKDFDKLQGIGESRFECIREMVDALVDAEKMGVEEEIESARDTIENSPLTVMVRTNWFFPGQNAEAELGEYEIMLSTGGPATRIVGELNEWGEPETARLEAQDWFLPWTEYRPASDSEYLLRFAGCFYFSM